MNIGTGSATHSSTGAGDLSVHDLADVEMRLAEDIRMRCCHQDGQQAAGPAPGAGHVQEEGRNG